MVDSGTEDFIVDDDISQLEKQYHTVRPICQSCKDSGRKNTNKKLTNS